MGKSKKRSRLSHQRSGRAQSTSSCRRFLLRSTGIIVAGILAGFGLYRFTRASSQPGQEQSFDPKDLTKLPRYETRQTLYPNLFMGTVAAAYAVAKQTPALLDQLYCYCQCKENHGHKSLLTCYVGRHASV
jgi:hypothetical protein